MKLTTEEFKDKIFDYEETPEWKFKGDKATTIRFTASWCQPCKAYAPIYEEVASETPNIDFYTVDVDEEPQLAQMFGVKSVPTTVFIPKDGSKPSAGAGTIQKEKLNEVISDLLES